MIKLGSFFLSLLLLANLAQPLRAQADLRGYDGRPFGNSYFFDCQQTSASWGQNIGIKLAVGNYGGSAAAAYTINVYISETRNFTANSSTCWQIITVTSTGLPAGHVDTAGYFNVQLPTVNPFGDNATTFYVGMVINPSLAAAESNYANNSNLGPGIDSATNPITISSLPAIVVAGSNPPGSKSVLNFGDVNLNGSTTKQTVTLSNAGLSSLNVSGIVVAGAGFSLGPIISDIQQLSQPVFFPHLIPGKSSEHWALSIIYNPTAVGVQTGTLTIVSNDPLTPSITYALTGTGVAVPHLVLTNPVPSNNNNLIANYGGVATNTSTSQTFTLKNSGTATLNFAPNAIGLTSGGAWTLVSVTSSTQGAINLATATTLAPNNAETWSVVIKFSPTSNQGYSTSLQVVSNDPTSPLACVLQGLGQTPMTLKIVSAVDGATQPNPLILNFGSLHATGQQNLSGTVTLTNTGQLPLTVAKNGITLASGVNFQINGLTSSTQGALNLTTAAATLAPNSAESWTINLTFAPTISGNDNTLLTILSDDPAHGNQALALNGTGLNQPGISVVTPGGTSALPFGPILNDGAGKHLGLQTFTLQNIGLQPLVISQNGLGFTNANGYSIQGIVSSTQGTIILNNGTKSIAANQAETWTVTVGLDPTGNSSYSGTLTIASNDPLKSSVALTLSGSGTTPTLTLNPTTSVATALSIQAGQVYNVTWSASDTADTASTAVLTLAIAPTNTLPASGLTTIATLPFSAITKSYAWRPDVSLVGKAFYIYGSLVDTGVSANSFSAQKVQIEAVGSFNLLTPLTTTSGTYIYQYLYQGKAYGGAATLQPGENVINITTGGVVHQIRVTLTDSLLAKQGYTYDELNRIKTYTNGNGITTTYTYDLVGNLINTLATNGNSVTYTYDVGKRRTSMLDSTGTTFYTYDDLDRVTAITYSTDNIKGNADDLVLAYQYDAGSHVTGMTYPGGEQVNYSFDAAGRLLTVDDVVNATTTYHYSYVYDATKGLLLQVNRANGVVTTYGYDAVGRLNDIKHVNRVGHTLAEYFYTLDVNGNATALVTTFDDGSVKQEAYTYDGQQRLTAVTYGTANPAVVNRDKTVVYSYDSVGNRLTQTTTINNAVTQKLTYTYGSENRLLQIKDQTGAVTSSYVYDAAGNRIQKITPSGNTYYAYDEKNLLTMVLTPNNSVSYKNNGLAQRTFEKSGEVIVQYLYTPSKSGFRIIQERTTGVILKNNIYGIERFQSNFQGSGLEYYLTDRLGSVRLLIDNTDSIKYKNYDVFGSIR